MWPRGVGGKGECGIDGSLTWVRMVEAAKGGGSSRLYGVRQGETGGSETAAHFLFDWFLTRLEIDSSKIILFWNGSATDSFFSLLNICSFRVLWERGWILSFLLF